MPVEPQLAAISIDLTRLHRRTVTSFYSNLVTRPTGRAVRMGVEQQLAELGRDSACVSILDFSQVHVLDYSCADEIVAKLLLRYSRDDRPVDAYFVARGLRDHHLESVEAVLDRHHLLLVTQDGSGLLSLLGPCDSLERDCWTVLGRSGRATAEELAVASGQPFGRCTLVIERLLTRRVAVPHRDGAVGPIPQVEDE